MSQSFCPSRRRLLASSALAAVALTLAPAFAPSLAAYAETSAKPGSAKPGAAAPAFTLDSASGAKVSLADFKGKTVVLEWTNHDCPFVKKHYSSGNMQNLQREAAKNGIVWLTIISSEPGEQGHVSAEEANKLTASRGAVPAQVLFDPKGTVGRAYGAKTTPHMYIITPDGKLAFMGGIDDKPSADVADIEKARNHVKEALAELAAGKPVSTPQTRPYGCAIKYAS